MSVPRYLHVEIVKYELAFLRSIMRMVSNKWKTLNRKQSFIKINSQLHKDNKD